MHSFTRGGRRSRWFPVVERPDISLFLSLDEAEQFEDLRELRTRTAHLGGGSLAAFTAMYLSVSLVVLPIFLGSILARDGPFAVATPDITGAAILILGLLIAYSFMLEQRDMARASARLAFYDEALQQQRAQHAVDGTRGKLAGVPAVALMAVR